jgi:hypothetical protein
LETRSNNLHCAMMWQQTTLFAKMGNLGGWRRCRTATAKTGDDNNYNEGEEDKDDNGGEVLGGEGGGVEVQNQICRHCHHRDEGGREDLMIATLGRDDTYPKSALCAYMVLSNVQLAAGEGGGTAQNVLEDDEGIMIVGGGEDRGKDCGKADGNGHGHGHGHG